MGCWPFFNWITAGFFLGLPLSGRIFDASRPTCVGSKQTRQIEFPLPLSPLRGEGVGGRGVCPSVPHCRGVSGTTPATLCRLKS